MKKRVADIIMDTLIEYGIDTCFAVVGGGAMHLDNALLVCDKMKKIFNHHEQACSMAADAYARYSGKMAAVCVTSGPGATNAITGVMGAWVDNLPMIVLSGQVRYAVSVPQSGLNLRYRGIQEFDIIGSVKNMTKYAKMIINPLEIKREVVKAINLAMDGRRGPVWLDIPQDIQNAMVEEDELYDVEEFISEVPSINEKDIDEIIEIIQDAERPCILLGSGIIATGNRDKCIEVLQNVKIPILGASWVSDSFYAEHEMFFGNSGDAGPRTGNFILQNADVILSIGNTLHFRQTSFKQDEFAPQAKVIMVYPDDEESKKPGLNIHRFIQADIRDILDKLNGRLKNIEVPGTWLSYCQMLKKRFSPYESIENLDMKERVSSYYFWKKLSEYEAEDSILSLGNNTACSSKLQVGTKKAKQRVMTNYNCGSMGFELPAAIGAAMASGKSVTCVTGDGSIMMNLQELQTIKHYDLPINVVVFSNGGYAALRRTFNNFYNGAFIGCTPDTGVGFPDFEDVAKTFGYEYYRCESNEQVEEYVKKLCTSDKRIFVEMCQKYEDLVAPRLMSRIDENGVMQSPALHDMYPFLDKEEMDELMISRKQ